MTRKLGSETQPSCFWTSQRIGITADCLRASGYLAIHQFTFAKFPNNKATLISRMAIRNTVIDYERVDRGDGETPPFDVIAIYTFRGDKIARVDFAK